MADNPFLAQLLGVNTSPYDTTFGQLSEAIGAATPRLVNPYASPGRNLASVAGAGLLAGLLGYQAKREAEAENRAVLPQLTALLGAKTPEEMATLTQQEAFPSRMLPLAQSLMLKQIEKQSSAAEDAAKFERDLKLQQEKNKGEFAAKYGLPGVLGLADIAQAGEPLLTPAEQLVEKNRQESLKLEKYSKREEAKQRIAANDVTKKYAELQSIRDAAQNLIGRSDKAAGDTLKKLFTKALDPSSTITLPEFALNNQMQSVFEQMWGTAQRLTSGSGELSDETKREMISVINEVMKPVGTRYNELVESGYANAAQVGLANKRSELRPFPKYVNPKEAQQLAQVVANLERLKAMGKATPEMIARVAAEIERVRGND